MSFVIKNLYSEQEQSKKAKRLRSSLSVLGSSFVRVEGLEPPSLTALDPKSSVSTNFTTPEFFSPMCPMGVEKVEKFKTKISKKYS